MTENEFKTALEVWEKTKQQREWAEWLTRDGVRVSVQVFQTDPETGMVSSRQIGDFPIELVREFVAGQLGECQTAMAKVGVELAAGAAVVERKGA